MYCVLVIDMLYEFVYGRLSSPYSRSIVPNIVKIVDMARKHGVPVIHVVDSHLPVDIEVRRIWGPHAMKGSTDSRIIPELEPRSEREFVLEKRWYSGFRGTGLAQLLRDLDVKCIIVTGIATNICVLHTVSDAVYERFDVIIVSDATAAIPVIFEDPVKEHEMFLRYMSKVHAAKIVRTEDVLSILTCR